MKNHAISTLSKQASDLSAQVARDAAQAAEYEKHARIYRAAEAEGRRCLAQTDAAIEAIRAAERRAAIYGREVVR